MRRIAAFGLLGRGHRRDRRRRERRLERGSGDAHRSAVAPQASARLCQRRGPAAQCAGQGEPAGGARTCPRHPRFRRRPLSRANAQIFCGFSVLLSASSPVSLSSSRKRQAADVRPLRRATRAALSCSGCCTLDSCAESNGRDVLRHPRVSILTGPPAALHDPDQTHVPIRRPDRMRQGAAGQRGSHAHGAHHCCSPATWCGTVQFHILGRKPMSDVVVFREGGYRFFKAVFQYSSGVAAEHGFEIERVRLLKPLPLTEGFAAIEAHLKGLGRPNTAFAACELRSAVPFTEQGFHDFNREYVKTLARWGIYRDEINPVARTNVCPEHDKPAEPSLYAFSYTVPAPNAKRGSFIIAGGGEMRGGAGSLPERIEIGRA